MNNLFLTMLTLWRLGYFDDDSPEDDNDDSDDFDEGDEGDVPPWFKPPYWE